tara:strand:- start:65 stop:274 length:210 start_codon:yes stop_codon:yes gene_type:complete
MGLVIYEFELPVIIYNILCGAIYLTALFITAARKESDGSFGNNNLHSFIDYRSNESAFSMQTNKEKDRA